MARSILNATKIAAVKSLLAQGASIKNVSTRTGVTRHRVQTIGAGPSEFKPSPRDPDWRAIDAAYADGKGRGLTKLWLDYCAAQDWPLAYSTFLRRRALWIAAGRPSGVAEPLPKAELSPPVRRGIAGPSPEAPAPRASILIASGLAFIDAAGVALRVRPGALSVRFPDGAERHFSRARIGSRPSFWRARAARANSNSIRPPIPI